MNQVVLLIHKIEDSFKANKKVAAVFFKLKVFLAFGKLSFPNDPLFGLPWTLEPDNISYGLSSGSSGACRNETKIWKPLKPVAQKQLHNLVRHGIRLAQ